MDAWTKANGDYERSYMAAKSAASAMADALLARGPSGVISKDSDFSRDELRLQHYRGTTYSLMWVDYPLEALTSTKEVLDYAVAGALYNSGAKIIEQKEIKLKSFPGRELRGESALGLPMWARIYLVGRRLFQLTVSGLNRPESVENARKFLESFELREEVQLESVPKP